MAAMGRFGRWAVNLGNARRSARLLDRIGPSLHLPPSPRLLELGTGRGGLSALLFERYSPARLVVTDFDPSQVEAARSYLTGRWGSLPGAVEVRPADALNLPFDDGAFDGVFAINVLHHVEARHSDYLLRPIALREVRRVLRPEGELVYAEFSRVREMRATLQELGFSWVLVRTGWKGREVAVVRAPAHREGSRRLLVSGPSGRSAPGASS